MQALRSLTGDWRRPFWVLLLITASVVFSLGFACAMPFAALCAAAACTLSRRHAYFLTGAAWAVNQVIGFGFLHYPCTANCVAWGVAIGLSALLCTLSAHWARWGLMRLHPLAGWGVAFVAAFATFEAVLAATSLALGGIENFMPSIVVGIFAVNAAAWTGFFALNWAVGRIGLAPTRPPLARLRDEAAMG